MPAIVIKLFSSALSILALVAFGWLYAVAVTKTVHARTTASTPGTQPTTNTPGTQPTTNTPGTQPTTNTPGTQPTSYAPAANVVYIATALAGLVGGFVASAFGQKLPEGSKSISAFFKSGTRSLGSYVVAESGTLRAMPRFRLREWIGIAYVAVYFLTGIAAALTWLTEPPNLPTPDMIKNLALITIGLVIAIAGTYMREQQPKL